ncbi:zinc finger and BTB domain-containing protein 5-like isoform X6 [Ostrea edulis]|uniref:zinc finger and BTB domain-containing protein 5-like isoform X6 n=1 Tax=Ostrea edulis TaxID=37623 RepID=UPI002094E485|nr:zinc finger and BTB domain-containing protein 5-like isoform X6 [Ostrea edulis]XP_055996280.1 zinc finger and BTB domain-containing protein 5-like isoform X6 [Ostrea edulis]
MNYQKVYMNQIYSSSIMRQVAQMWKNQLLCDAVIKTGNIQTKAHRLVLIAACPMLQHMENASVGSHLEVRLNADIKQNSVTAFLQYLYEGYMMLTEENCKDVEKIAKLLHADGVAKCCIDFQKCLTAKSGMSSYDGANFEMQDSVEFRYVCSTNIQKTLQDGAMKRSSDSSGKPPSPDNKRARVQPSSPSGLGQRMDDRFSMAHSYTQDPFERVPRLGSGFSQPKPPPGVIEIIEDSVELVTTDPPERDANGWPKKSDRPPVQKSMSISVAGQVKGGDSDVQIINVSSSGVPPQSKQPNIGRGRHDPTNERLSSSFDQSQPTKSSQKQPPYNMDQSPRTDLEGAFQRQQLSQTAQTKQPPARTSHPGSHHPPQLKHMSASSVQSSQKSFAAGSPSQASFTAGSASQVNFAAGSAPQSSSPQIIPTSVGTISVSPRNVPEPSPPLPSPIKPSADVSRRQPTLLIDQPQSESTPPNQDLTTSNSQEKDTATQKAIEMHSDDVERLLAASEPVAMQSDNNADGKSVESTTGMTVIKIEEDEDTGGLDMYVDIPDDIKHPVNLGSQDDLGEPSEIEDPPGEWSREDFSNESSGLGGDPNVSWQDGSFSKARQLPAAVDPHAFVRSTCHVCGDVCRSRSELVLHLRTRHNFPEADLFRGAGEIVPQGNACMPGNLMTHPMEGENEPFTCPHCQKTFNFLCHFKRHLVIHSEARPHKCNICSNGFKRRDHLIDHIRRKHGQTYTQSDHT